MPERHASKARAPQGPFFDGALGSQFCFAAIAADRLSVPARSRDEEPTLTQDYFGHA